MNAKPQRINVIGTTGSGKSTFSRQLAQKLNIPHVEMDFIYWRPNWQGPTDEEYLQLVEKALEGKQWVLDGNYGRTTHIKWRNVQMVVWLDYPLYLVTYRSLKRSLSRIISQDELWAGTGNKESFRRSFLSKDSILIWMIKTYHKNRERYIKAMQDKRFAHIQFVRLSSPQEAERFLKEIAEQ